MMSLHGPLLLAPDALKGSMRSVHVLRSMEAGLGDAGFSGARIHRPMADGGDGTLDALQYGGHGRIFTAEVRGPYEDMMVKADWLLLDDGVAVIEMARACGMALSARQSPMTASTYGVGQLVNEAVAAGAKEVWIGAGGSATIDGGKGLAEALGFSFFDKAGCPLPSGGGSLIQLETIVAKPSAVKVKIKVLCDVDNPAVGPRGAAQIYGPQKGASDEDIPLLDAGLGQLCDRLSAGSGEDLKELKFGGAAGGIGLVLKTLFQAQLCSGFDVIAERVALKDALEAATLVLTAEGRIDEQSNRGKTVGRLIHWAKEASIPVWAFAGSVTPKAEAMCPENTAYIPICSQPMSLTQAVRDGAQLVRGAVARTFRLARLTGCPDLRRAD